MNKDNTTIIESRHANGELHDSCFDGPLHAIKKAIEYMVENGCHDFKVVENPNGYDFYFLNDYE